MQKKDWLEQAMNKLQLNPALLDEWICLPPLCFLVAEYAADELGFEDTLFDMARIHEGRFHCSWRRETIARLEALALKNPCLKRWIEAIPGENGTVLHARNAISWRLRNPNLI